MCFRTGGPLQRAGHPRTRCSQKIKDRKQKTLSETGPRAAARGLTGMSSACEPPRVASRSATQAPTMLSCHSVPTLLALGVARRTGL
jgi:hypothetical protein